TDGTSSGNACGTRGAISAERPKKVTAEAPRTSEPRCTRRAPALRPITFGDVAGDSDLTSGMQRSFGTRTRPLPVVFLLQLPMTTAPDQEATIWLSQGEATLLVPFV